MSLQGLLISVPSLPRQLDPAMLRRLEKRILVPLPGKVAREAMFRHHLPESITDLEDVGHTITTHLDYERLAKVTLILSFTTFNFFFLCTFSYARFRKPPLTHFLSFLRSPDF